MTREIEFRGFDSREWRYGDLEYNRKDDVARIHTYKEDGSYGKQYLVDPYTVGEFTGMRDRHGKKVFEGDVVRRKESAFGYVKTGVVKYDCHLGAFVLEYESYGETCKSTFDNEFSENDGNCTIRGTYSYEVIGNVYDNSDLLLSK